MTKDQASTLLGLINDSIDLFQNIIEKADQYGDAEIYGALNTILCHTVANFDWEINKRNYAMFPELKPQFDD